MNESLKEDACMRPGARGARLVLWAGVVPATLVSLPFLVIGALSWPVVTYAMVSQGSVWQAALSPGDYSISELVPVTVPFGIWGLYALWSLALHYLKSDARPSAVLFKSLGLVAGSVASAQLLVHGLLQPERGGLWLAPFLCLALLSGVYFLILVITSQRRGVFGGATGATDQPE